MTFAKWLLLLFIALKLTGHVGWSWWWVLAPAWAEIAYLVVTHKPKVSR